MRPIFCRWARLLGVVVLTMAGPGARAQDRSPAVLDVLVRKGVLTRVEADAVLAETSATPAAPVLSIAGKSTSRLSLGARVQTQFVAFDSNLDGSSDPAVAQHFLMRRVCVTANAELGPDWSALVIYNFVADVFDAAVLEWKQPDFTAGFGYRMVNLGREHRTSNGSLKAAERSAPTRYFMECQNGTRLGAGSYRVGAFIDGTRGDVFWGAAITNPEQASTLALTGGSGNSNTNTPALWLNGGVNRALADGAGTLTVGGGLGWIPGQGGAPAVAGEGDDLIAGTIFAELNAGRFSLLAEVLGAESERGAADLGDARAWGAYVQPSWKFTPALEGVVRIGYLDTDGRGVTPADGVPGAPSPAGTTFDRMTETYVGGNWYLKGDDVKLQAGFIYARATDAVAGGAEEATTVGVRSQLQVNF